MRNIVKTYFRIARKLTLSVSLNKTVTVLVLSFEINFSGVHKTDLITVLSRVDVSIKRTFNDAHPIQIGDVKFIQIDVACADSGYFKNKDSFN